MRLSKIKFLNNYIQLIRLTHINHYIQLIRLTHVELLCHLINFSQNKKYKLSFNYTSTTHFFSFLFSTNFT